MHCYIIGITGFLGRSLAAQLVQQGHYVAGCGSSAGGLETEEIEYDCIDLAVESVVIPNGIDVVYYLAQSPHYRTFPEGAGSLFAVNTFGAIKAAESAIKAGVKLFCFASTGNVYAPSFIPLAEDAPTQRGNAYSLSKLMAEEALDLFCDKMAVVSVRIFGLFGPGQQAMLPYYLYNAVLNEHNIFIQSAPDSPDDGGLQVSFVYCPDVAKILGDMAYSFFMGQNLPKRLNIGGKEAVSIKHFAEMLGKVLGKEPTFVKSEEYRTFDLIANIDLLHNLISPQFTSFESAVHQSYSIAYANRKLTSKGSIATRGNK